MGYRYIGSKTKLLNEVLTKIKEIVPKGAHVTDLMCGTGAVSQALIEHGFVVTACDLMTYSYHHARILLNLSSPPPFLNTFEFIETNLPRKSECLFPQTAYEQILSALNNLKPVKGYFWKEFSKEGRPKNKVSPRNYFSPENAKKIDAIRVAIKTLRLNNKLTSIEHSLLIHDLIMAANDIANIAGTYGHYLSKLAGRAKDPIKLKPTVCFSQKSSQKNMVYCGRAEDIAAKIRTDLCYMDPPYMKRQYAANYHILETLAREDEPEAIGISGLRPWRDQYSNFCTKTKIRESFTQIFEKMDCENFLISYSEDGLLKINELVQFFSQFGIVRVSNIENKRFKSNNSPLDSKITEYLIYLKKKKTSFQKRPFLDDTFLQEPHVAGAI